MFGHRGLTGTTRVCDNDQVKPRPKRIVTVNSESFHQRDILAK